MSEITLEKVDLIRERTGVSYTVAKEALEVCNGEVLEALVFIENNNKNKGGFYQTKDEFIGWIKEMVNKGNVTRIKIKKDDKVLVDLPVSAGIAVTGLTAILSVPLLAIGVLSAVVTKVTVEITKEDGTVEVVNKYIKDTMGDMKGKIDNLTGKLGGVAEEVKEVISEVAEDIKDKMKNRASASNGSKSEDTNTSEENVYKYTVNFEEVDDKNKEESDK
jgi:translation elongation factor EF-Ts